MASKPSSIQLGCFRFEEVAPCVWELPSLDPRRVAVRFIASRQMMQRLDGDLSVQQAADVATLPGVLNPVLAMPDVHQGYGFPIGGVAAFHPTHGVVSPGGVGYDINCGVRLLVTDVRYHDVAAVDLERALKLLAQRVPAGMGSAKGSLKLETEDLNTLLSQGAKWVVERGLGEAEDLENAEEQGALTGANPSAVSSRAKERGLFQLGSLGSGNHFLEIGRVDQIFDRDAADTFGIVKDQITILIHTGSRGLGYQVCSDYLEESLHVAERYGLGHLPRELASLPLTSPEGRRYLGAMAAAANFAFANRQVLNARVRDVFRIAFSETKVRLLYDVCHNIAKFEEFVSKGRPYRACVHRKGATRAYPPRHSQVPARYRVQGQPVIVPGDMGRCSYVLVGTHTAMERSFGSSCHGAGRELSRAQAKKIANGRNIARELRSAGILVASQNPRTLAEEMSEAYKNVDEVIAAASAADLTRPVARLKPLAVLKG